MIPFSKNDLIDICEKLSKICSHITYCRVAFREPYHKNEEYSSDLKAFYMNKYEKLSNISRNIKYCQDFLIECYTKNEKAISNHDLIIMDKKFAEIDNQIADIQFSINLYANMLEKKNYT